MIDLQKLISDEIDKQFRNREIAGKAWATRRIKDEIRYHIDALHTGKHVDEKLASHDKQIKKLFALFNNLQVQLIPKPDKMGMTSIWLKAIGDISDAIANYEERLIDDVECLSIVNHIMSGVNHATDGESYSDN